MFPHEKVSPLHTIIKKKGPIAWMSDPAFCLEQL
jgi:hypothetical protein